MEYTKLLVRNYSHLPSTQITKVDELIAEKERELKSFTNTKYRKGQWSRFNKFIEAVIQNKEDDMDRIDKARDEYIYDHVLDKERFVPVSSRTRDTCYKSLDIDGLYIHGATYTYYDEKMVTTTVRDGKKVKINPGESGTIIDYFVNFEGWSVSDTVDHIMGENYTPFRYLSDVDKREREHEELKKKKKREEDMKEARKEYDENLVKYFPQELRDKDLEKVRTELKHLVRIHDNKEYSKKKIVEYLCDRRGLSKRMIEALVDEEKILFDIKGNVVFKWVHNNEFVGASVRGSYANSTFKGIARGSSSYLGFTILHKTCRATKRVKKLFIFESAIDLLSFLDLHKGQEILNDALFVAVAGLKRKVFFNYFDMTKKMGLEEVYICTDNEASSVVFNEIIIPLVEDEGYKVNRLMSKNKDWNDDLVELKLNK